MESSGRKILSKEQADAYFLIFQHLYEYDTCLNTGIKYIAIDLTNVILTDTATLIIHMQNFCNSKGYALLQETFESLKGKGYIMGLLNKFEEGILITFKDKELSQNTLFTSVEKWRDGRGARGADYTVEKKSGFWEITKVENEWVS